MAPLFKKVLGVDLGFNAVKIVEVALEKSGCRVVRAASAPTGASPTMTPEEVRAAILAATKDLVRKSRFTTKNAIFSISGQNVFIRRFRVPKSTDERLAKMIQYEARQQIPFPVDKGSLQYQTRELPEEGEVEVLLVAIRGEKVVEAMQTILKTGLTPVCVGVSSFALYNANRFLTMSEAKALESYPVLAKAKKKPAKAAKDGAPAEAPGASNDKTIKLDEAPPEAEEEFSYEEVRGYINMGATSYDLAIARSKATAASFYRTVPTGGNEITRQIMKACNIESFADAERVKTSATQLMSFQFDFESENQLNQEASMAATEVVDRMVTEIRRSLDFFITQPDGMAIDTVVLSGGQSLLPGFDSYLEEKLSVRVTKVGADLNAESALKWPENAGPVTPYVIALGLALQGLQLADLRVDFLPEEKKIIRDFPYTVTAVMAAVILATIAISSQAGTDYAEKYERNRTTIELMKSKEESQKKAFDEAQQLHLDVAANFENVNKLFGQRTYWVDFLGKLAEIKPPEVVFEDVQLDHEGKVRIQGLSQVQVSAAFFQKALATELKERLKEDPVIDGVSTLRNPPPPWDPSSPPSRFVISFQLKDKINHLNITPTPPPTPVGGGPAQGGPGGGYSNQYSQPQRPPGRF